jgi:hypothetical protein
LLLHDREREIIPVAAFVVNVEGVAREDDGGSTPGASKHFQPFLNGLISMMVTTKLRFRALDCIMFD